ncbi:MAG: tRNA (adenosine(37)-N6)-dimethylallyltransferase MiaA [Alphaproteobacteria bacterium]
MERKVTNQVFLIAGPTASGKSSLALEFAARVQDKGGARIINADSMQIYRDLSIVTACPSAAELAQVDHRLYGVLDGAQRCSVARWLDLAVAEVKQAWADGALPIVVGGTGLYFKALTEGLAPVPEVSADIWDEGKAILTAGQGPALHAELVKIDPQMAARLNPTDPQRVLRAWSVMRGTGRSLADWQNDPVDPPLRDAIFHKWVLMPDREWLYARCDRRFHLMMAEGALDEVRALVVRGLDPTLPVMKAVGVPQLAAFLAGDISEADAIANAQMQSRRYAKRQLTWGRNQMIAWNSVNEQQMESVCDKMLSKIL